MEQECARIARTQHGVVTRAQLLAAGVSADEIRWRLGTGALLREHRGVYLVGHRAPSVEARYLAAVWACGEGALLSGHAAGYLLVLLKIAAPAPEVTTPRQRRIQGVRTRRSPLLDPRDATTWRAIPVTTVARTLVDLSADLAMADLARACHEAGIRHGTTPTEVKSVLACRPNSPGATNLRRVLLGDVPVTLSKLERRFLERLREAGLPLPQTIGLPAGGGWTAAGLSRS